MNNLLRGTLFLCLLSNAFGKLKIGAFNIQVFGQSKIKEPQVVDVLLRVSCTLCWNYKKPKVSNYYFVLYLVYISFN